MIATSGSRIDMSGSEEATRHLIDNAHFGLSFGGAERDWPDELELARIVKTELLSVVNEVFDAHTRTNGALCIEKLEVDLGALVSDGSLSNLRERLREGVYRELVRAVEGQGSEASARPEGILPAAGFDTLAHFLHFGVLPWHAKFRDRQRMERLLQDFAGAEPERLAGLIRNDAVAAARLARQFPDAVVRQIIATLNLDDAQVQAMLAPDYQVSGQAVNPREAEDAGVSQAQTGEVSLDQTLSELERRQPESLAWLFGKLRSGEISLASVIERLSTAGHRRLLAGVVAEATRQTAGASELQQAIAAQAQRVDNERDFYRQLLERLVNDELIDVEAIAARSTMPDDRDARRQTPEQNNLAGGRRPLPGSERLFRAYDLYATLIGESAGEQVRQREVIDELARDHAQQFQRLLLELRSGVLKWRSIAARLSDAELRRLVPTFVTALGPADADRRLFLQSIDDHARRARDERSFYLQLLQRLADDKPVDLEAIAALPAEQEGYGREALHAGGTRSSSVVPEDLDDGETVQLLRDYLGASIRLPDSTLAALRRAVERLLASQPQQLAELLRQSLKGEQAPVRLVGLLPERLLTRILYLLAPAGHERIQRYADAIASICTAGKTAIACARVTALKWQFCFQYLIDAAPGWDADLFVQRFADLLANYSDRLDAGALNSLSAHPPGSQPQRLAAHLRLALKGDKEIVRLTTTERRGKDDPGFEAAEVAVAPAATDRLRARKKRAQERSTNDTGTNRALLEQGVRIANAGQVLAAPYLPRLFGVLDLIRNGAFSSFEAQERAVHLLQYMVDGSSDTAEYELVLNKLLCGMETRTAINREILVTDAEKAAIDGLLRGMVQNWQALKNTSVNGLRESFLQRAGWLRLDSDGWHLSVESKAFDMLLDRIPWSFSVIKHAWMKEVIYVEWR